MQVDYQDFIHRLGANGWQTYIKMLKSGTCIKSVVFMAVVVRM